MTRRLKGSIGTPMVVHPRFPKQTNKRPFFKGRTKTRQMTPEELASFDNVISPEQYEKARRKRLGWTKKK